MALRLTNYFIHPTDNRYQVFVFKEDIYADYFEDLLKREAIEYERHLDDAENEILFGIHKKYQKQAMHSNFLTHAKFRRPFIGNRLVKYSLLIITFGIIIFAFVGYLRTR